MTRSEILIRCLAFAVLCSPLAGCGQKKIDGPFPETGDLTLRALVLVDPSLPALSDADVRRVLEISEKQMESRLRPARRVRFESVVRRDLQQEFDRLMVPFGKIAFASRLDPLRPLPEEARRVLYARVMELLRTNKLRPMLPLFSMDPNTLDVSGILDTVVTQFDRSVENLRNARPLFSPAYQTDAVRDRRSVFAWYTVLGAVLQDSKPADLILTNDLLIFDSLFSIPPECLVSGGMTAGYSRPYPGVALVSTIPFLSDEPMFAVMRGDPAGQRRLDLLAWAISREVGGELILMNQDEFSHKDCLNRIWVPPFVEGLDLPEGVAGACPERHEPRDRRGLLTAYLSELIRISAIGGNFDQADRVFDRLVRLSPTDPAVPDLQAFLTAARSKKVAP